MKIQPGTLQALVNPTKFEHYTSVALRGFSAQRKGEDWQVIFRGTKRTGEDVYCLFVAVDLEVALEGLYTMARGRQGASYWYPDKYAK